MAADSLKLLNAITAAKFAAAQYVLMNAEGPNWWPCGFATMHYKCRKNAKEAKVLEASGFRWDDYRKSFYITAYEWTNTQSMDYKSAILGAAIEAARKYGIEFSLETRMD